MSNQEKPAFLTNPDPSVLDQLDRAIYHGYRAVGRAFEEPIKFRELDLGLFKVDLGNTVTIDPSIANDREAAVCTAIQDVPVLGYLAAPFCAATRSVINERDSSR